MIISFKNGNGITVIDNIRKANCYPAKKEDVSLTTSPAQTTIAEIEYLNGQKEVLAIEEEGFLRTDCSSMMFRIHI